MNNKLGLLALFAILVLISSNSSVHDKWEGVYETEEATPTITSLWQAEHNGRLYDCEVERQITYPEVVYRPEYCK